MHSVRVRLQRGALGNPAPGPEQGKMDIVYNEGAFNARVILERTAEVSMKISCCHYINKFMQKLLQFPYIDY